MRKRLLAAFFACVGALGCLNSFDSPLKNCTPILSSVRDPSSNPRLDIKFTDPLRIHDSGANQMCSEVGADLSALNAVLDRAGVVDIENWRIDRAAYERLVQDAIRLSGAPGPDMLSWHTLWLAPDADVAASIHMLSDRREVQYVYQVSNIDPPPP